MTIPVTHTMRQSLVRVRSEEVLEAADAPAESLLGRSVIVDVEEALWTVGSAEKPELARGERFSLVTWGWWLKPGQEPRPLAPVGEPRIEVGGRYVLALAMHDPTDSWAVIGGGGVLEILEDGQLQQGVRGLERLLGSSADGRPADSVLTDIDSLRVALTSVLPDDAVLPLLELPPPDRVRAVAELTEAG